MSIKILPTLKYLARQSPPFRAHPEPSVIGESRLAYHANDYRDQVMKEIMAKSMFRVQINMVYSNGI